MYVSIYLSLFQVAREASGAPFLEVRVGDGAPQRVLRQLVYYH